MYSRTIFVCVLLATVCTVRAERLQPISNENAMLENDVDGIVKCSICKLALKAAQLYLNSDRMKKMEKEQIAKVCKDASLFEPVCTSILQKVADYLVNQLVETPVGSLCTKFEYCP
ncbi:hypothetical protein D915_010310 [Fasciola hepatica]|uniref:Saposin B-type domain-containing protein n=1 Tax=Fasciola hepatica TaxID=6192 RepID=A0A4E0QVX4_FASHE|nr:hypothetical protein D915_010310 [Fasciola hepatica]